MDVSFVVSLVQKCTFECPCMLTCDPTLDWVLYVLCCVVEVGLRCGAASYVGFRGAVMFKPEAAALHYLLPLG